MRPEGARRAGPVVVTASAFAKPVRSVGGFFAMSLDTFVAMFKPPFAWREFILQTWFVARVSIVPTLMLAIPFTVLLVFTFNILLVEFGDDAGRIEAALVSRGVVLRPMGGYGLGECLRITVGTEAENARLLAVLDEVMA